MHQPSLSHHSSPCSARKTASNAALSFREDVSGPGASWVTETKADSTFRLSRTRIIPDRLPLPAFSPTEKTNPSSVRSPTLIQGTSASRTASRLVYRRTFPGPPSAPKVKVVKDGMMKASWTWTSTRASSSPLAAVTTKVEEPEKPPSPLTAAMPSPLVLSKEKSTFRFPPETSTHPPPERPSTRNARRVGTPVDAG